MNVATDPRERLKINLRKITAYGYYGAGKMLRSLGKNDERVIRHIIYYPTVKDIATLSDLANRASWYLPQSEFSQVKVSIPVDAELLGTNLETLVIPPFQHNYIGRSKNIRLIDCHKADLSQADTIMLWNKAYMFCPSVLRHLARLNVVDPLFYSIVESFLSARLYFQTIESQQKEKFSQLSKSNYQTMLDQVAVHEKGYAFGTGPSLERAAEFDYSGGFRVVCNTIVKNKALLEHIKPQLLVFQDLAFFFGPSRYSAEFRQMMIETVRKFQCYIMVPYHSVPLLLAHYPELESKIIGVQIPGIVDMSVREIIWMLIRISKRIFNSSLPLPTKIPGHGEEFNFPTPDKLYVRASTNVMTTSMLPVVSSICEEIYIIGADGRKPDESYVWTYNPSSQLGDIMQTIFDTHPSIFRDSVYTDYYKEHCDFFENLLRYGESMEKKYYSLTPSYIPALAKRPAPPEKMGRNK
jgi:hypothetical protein